MSTTATTTIPNEAIEQTTTGARMLRAGLGHGALAAAATTVMAVAARAVDIDLAVDGEQIPVLGFAQLTLIGALIGVVLAKASVRWSDRPRTTFIRTTVALTALSMVPDAMVDATTASKVVLALTHVVAAAIVVPALARRLAD